MASSEQNLDAIRDRYPPILTTAQVAELLGLNVRTVMVMANDGRLPASRLPGSRKYHFVLEDVLATLARHRIQPEVATATAPARASKASPTTKSEAARAAGATKTAKSASGTKRSAAKPTKRSTS